MTRDEIEALIDAKTASAFALVSKVDALMARVHDLLASTEAAFGATGARAAPELFARMRATVERLEELASLCSPRPDRDTPRRPS